VPALELHVDAAPRLVDPLLEVDQAVADEHVDQPDQEQQRDDDDDRNNHVG
jgi:hypothetical protein